MTTHRSVAKKVVCANIFHEWLDKSQDDFAFAIQLPELLGRAPVLLASQDPRKHRFFTEKRTEEIVKKISSKAFEASDFPNVDNLSEDSEERV